MIKSHIYNIPNFYSFLNSPAKIPARISPKQNSGANGKFLPKPSFSICDIRIQKQMSRSFGKSFPQKLLCQNFVRIVPPPARILGGQNPEKKNTLSFFKEISPPPNQESKECFSFGVAEALRGSGGTIRAYEAV